MPITAADRRRRIQATPLVVRLGTDRTDLRAVRADAKRRVMQRSRYESRIETMTIGLGMVLGYWPVDVGRAVDWAINSEDFETAFWGHLDTVEGRAPIATNRQLLRQLGLAHAHAYDAEIDIWKVKSRTKAEERHTAEVDVWAEIVHNQTNCGVSQARMYAERALRDIKPTDRAAFWAEFLDLVVGMIDRPVAFVG